MQFKGLGAQIKFFLNPNHLDLWALQKSFKTMIDRYYRAKLTSRTLFSLQDPINEIEKLCEIIRLISNKKAAKQCEDGIKNLRKLLDDYSAPSYCEEILNKNVEKISELTDAMTEGSDWFELAYYLQDKLYNSFRDCNQNYEFQEIIKTSKSGWAEALAFLKDYLPVVVLFGGLITVVLIVSTNNHIIHELKTNHLITELNSTVLNYQIELLKILLVPIAIFIVICSLYVNFILFNDNLVIDKNDVNVVNNWQDSHKFIRTLFIKSVISFVIICGLPFFVYYNITLFGSGGLIYLIDFVTIICLYLILKSYFKGFRKFLIALLSIFVIMIPMLISFLFVVLRNVDNLQADDYIQIILFGVVPVILMLVLEVNILNPIGKICLSVAIYLVASWLVVAQYINLLEFLGLRNNPNTISLLKLNGNSSSFTGQLQDMGFYQLQYNGNESQASDLQLERYIFTRGIESAIYLTSIAESQTIHLAELESYVINNKNTICNSKLNRAVLSEFENGDESKHYFGYEGCHANINSFKFNDKIKLVNKLFLVRQSESNYTYWIFGAHVSWKKPDELIISAAKNDNFNTITLNKDHGMLYYDETTLRVDGNPEDQHNFSLTRYGNESGLTH